MADNSLQLNKDKTEILVIGNKELREKISLLLQPVTTNIKNQVRSIGVIFDSEVNMEAHIGNVATLPFYHLRNISKVQNAVQNAAARVLTKTKRRAHITPILKSLQQLPVSFRIDFKNLLLVLKSLSGNAPAYMSAMTNWYVSNRPLRSAGTVFFN